MRDRLAARLFACTLAFYPPHLRERFGDEMADVFEEQWAQAWEQAGALGAARVLACALDEVATVAIPARLAPVAVPAIAAITALIWFVGMLGLIHVAH